MAVLQALDLLQGGASGVSDLLQRQATKPPQLLDPVGHTE